jgi:tetratricopeptide (TPR) repeat protein
VDGDILKAYPNDSDALIYHGEIRMREGDAGGAVTTLQTVIQNDPQNAMAHYHLGAAYGQMGHAEQARTEWEQALQMNPNLTDALRALATLALRQGDMPTLAQRASQIIQQQPASAEGYAMRAFSSVRRGQFASAEQDASEAISLAPGDSAGYMQMGNLRLAQKQYGAAEKSYQQALTLAPSSSDALSGLMNTYLAQKQVDKAVDAANTQIAKVPNNSAFYNLLGGVLFNGKKDLTGAEAAFTKATALDKTNENALVMLGQVQIAKGSAGQAVATYEHALQDNPRDISFYILLGDLYNSQHDLDKAEDAYHKALAIDSSNALVSNNLAYLLLQEGGNVDEAVALAQTARRSAPESPSFADTLGWALYHKGYYQQSVSLFQEAMRLAQKNNSPDNPTVHYHLGLAYEKSGDDASAKKELQRVLQLNPNFSAADEVKRALAELHS